MNSQTLRIITAGLLVLLIGGVTGYYLAVRGQPGSESTANSREILYYRNPMGLADRSPVPKKDSMGMDYIPVYADEEAPATVRKVLYYRNPMGLPDTSPVPKKDSMGMDYIPVYEGEMSDAGQVRLSPLKVQRLGVVTEVVQERVIAPPIRAVGTIETNERTLNTVAPRFEGWIETLYANETGGAVRRGDPLFSAYSPELVAAQQEYLLALGARAADPDGLGDSLLSMARERLLNWQIGEKEITALEREGVPQRAVLFRSPIDGVVLEKNAIEGARFMPGDALFLLADLRVVWMIARIYEQELSMLRLGQPVTLTVEAFPGEVFAGRISFIYPTLAAETRTAQIRVEFNNESLRLRPGMYGQIDVLPLPEVRPVVSVSDSAVLESGKRSVVLVQVAEGLFEPREVEIGRRGETFVEVRSGLAAGENVVVSANFLIDAESNLKAALDSFDKNGGPPGQAEASGVPGATGDSGMAGAQAPEPTARPEGGHESHQHPAAGEED